MVILPVQPSDIKALAWFVMWTRELLRELFMDLQDSGGNETVHRSCLGIGLRVGSVKA